MNYSDKPLIYMGLLIPMAIISYFVISSILNRPEYHKRNLLLLIILGYMIQMGFGLMEGRGIDSIRERMVTTGHSEFAKIAATEPELKDVTLYYEVILQQNDGLKFVQTKPPGHLLFYMMTEKLSNMILPSTDPAIRLQRLSNFASYLYPLLAYLVIIPLYYFGRMFLKSDRAILPCIMYLFIPSVTLVTLHLDQVLYPLLFVSGLLLILSGCKRNNIPLYVLSGAFIYFALYFSFSLLLVLPMGLLIAAAYINCYSEPDQKLKSFGRFLVGFVTGWILAQLLFWILLDYNIFIRYQNAMTFHQAWKNWDNSLSNIALYGILNYIEFICWIGLPVAILFLAGGRQKILEIVKGQFNIQNLFYAIVILIFILLGVFGKTKSEVGRLWIFMMPLVLIFVASELEIRFKEKTKSALWFILTFQLISILFIKRFQDFW